MSRTQNGVNQEQEVRVQNGWMMLVVLLGSLIADIALVVTTERPFQVVFALIIPLIVILMFGFFSLQPNEARVLVLFGKYKGTVRESGFHWGNPFYSNGPQLVAAQLAMKKSSHSTAEVPSQGQRSLGRNKISLRARTLNGEKLKV